MEHDNDAHFRKLIRETGTEAPSDDFMRAVMQRVREEAAFSAVVQQNALEMPSLAFSADIMAQIRAGEPVPAPRPFVARRMWYWVAAAWAAVLIACFFIPGNDQPLFSGTWKSILPAGSMSLEKVPVIPQPYMLTIIGLASLLLLDYFLRNKWVFGNKNGQVI
ncbi:hypothetical protein [Dyadobacter beijingensis]|nr:hypothetical protein [Dyadobacter beijingensis]